jgi:5-methylcytosine-specific restriction endonuclease McrA
MRTASEQAKARRACFEKWKWHDETGKIYLTCHICGGVIDPATERWEAEHVLRHALTKDNDAENVKPCHPRCHKPKTAKDVSENAKGKRVEAKHYGLKTRGWGGKYRKKMNGEVVER